MELRRARRRKSGAESDETEKYSREDRLLARERILSYTYIHISPREGKTRESTAGAANRARRGAYAPATAANYVSTELNLKDHCGRGRRVDDLLRASGLETRSPRRRSFAREIRAQSSPGSGGTPGRTDRWKSPGDDISTVLILSRDVGQSRRE